MGRSTRLCYLCDKAANHNNRTLHSFPKKSSEVVFARWLRVLDLNERDEVRNLKICSDHFIRNDYRNPVHVGGRLKPLAVPSVGVPRPCTFPEEELPELPALRAPRSQTTIEICDCRIPDKPIKCTDNVHTYHQTDETSAEEICPRPLSPIQVFLPEAPCTSTDGTDGMDIISIHSPPVPLSPGDVGAEMTLDYGEVEDVCPPTLSSTLVTATKTPGTGTDTNGMDVTVHSPRVSEPPDCQPTDTGASPLEGPKRRFAEPRFISEMELRDFATPEQAARTIRLAKHLDSRKSAVVRQKNVVIRRLENKVALLQQALAELKNKDTLMQDGIADCAYSLKSLHNDLMAHRDKVPEHWAFSFMGNKVILFFMGDKPHVGTDVGRSVTIQEDMSVEVRARGKLYPGEEISRPVRNLQDLLGRLKTVIHLRICKGLLDGSCIGSGFVSSLRIFTCPECYKQGRQTRDRSQKMLKRLKLRNRNLQESNRKLTRKVTAMTRNLSGTLEKFEEVRKTSAEIHRTAFDDAVQSFPEKQQELLRACRDAVHFNGPSGRRYSTAWIKECLLLRLQSQKAYIHLRERNILPLPTIATLEKYMNNLD